MAKKDLTSLVRKAQSGDAQAFSDLINESYETLYYYAYKTVKDQDLACDITQESCIEIMQTLDKLREPAAYHTWASRIVYHQCTRYFKQCVEVQAVEDEEGESILDQLPDERPGTLPEQVQEDKEFQKTILDMLDQLPAEQRTALMFYYYENMSVSQIAQIQDVSEGTVKSRLNYGRKAVKNKVEEYEKKHDVRLHSLAPLPLLFYFLFRQDAQTAVGAASKTLAGIVGGVGTAATTGAAAGTATTAGVTALGTKLIAGIIAAVVATTAVVGGSKLWKDRKDATQSTTQESVNHGTMEQWSALFGIWYGGVEHTPIFQLSENTAIIAGHSFHWDLEDGDYDMAGTAAALHLQNGDTHYLVDFTLEADGHWSAFVLEVLPTEDPNTWNIVDDGDCYFTYRPEDYEGYTLVMLTPENVMDYITAAPSTYEYYEDANFSGLMEYANRGFREGLGSASYCKIVPLQRKSYYLVTPDEAVAGIQTTPTRVYTFADFEDSWELCSRISSGGGGIGLNNLQDGKLTLSDTEILGAVYCQGYVLVPDDYQIPERTIDEDAALLDQIWGHWDPYADYVNDSPDGITIHRDGTVTINGFTANIQHIALHEPDSRFGCILLRLEWGDAGRAPVLYDEVEFRLVTDGYLLAEYLTETPSEHGGYNANVFYQPENE